MSDPNRKKTGIPLGVGLGGAWKPGPQKLLLRSTGHVPARPVVERTRLRLYENGVMTQTTKRTCTWTLQGVSWLEVIVV